MLGSDLVPLLSKRHEVVPMSRQDADLLDVTATREFLIECSPQAIIHAAAFTDVDGCETDQQKAFQQNADTTGRVAGIADDLGAHLTFISTDYVFDGAKEEPYAEDDRPSPLNVYGRSKLMGERAVLQYDHACVARTSWLFGRNGKNFVDTIRRLLAEKEHLRVVDDQIGSPTWTGSLSRMLAALVEAEATGIFHVTNRGSTTWFGFAREIAVRTGEDPERIRPCTTDAYPRPANRPPRSVLAPGRYQELGFPQPPSWQEALQAYLKESLPAPEI